MSWFYTVVFAGLVFSSQGSSTTASPAVQSAPAVIAEVARLDETEKFEQTYPLTSNGRLNVSNVNGSITVEAWDRNEVKLEYTKVADTKERLADVDIRIETRPDYFGVETDYSFSKTRNTGDRDYWKNGGKLNVEFRLMVPRGAVLNEIETVNGSVSVSNFVNTIKVSAVNGSVNAINIRGTAKLSTVNGEVKADFDRLESGSKISCETVNGRVNLIIPSDANATVKADSLNGNITNDWGLPVRKGKYVGRDLYGKLGNGEVQIRMSSVNGALAINRKSDGKNASPAVNLLTQKENDDEDWNWDFSFDIDDVKTNVNMAKANKDIEKATKAATKASVNAAAKATAGVSAAVTKQALADAQVELSKIQPDITSITAASTQMALDAIANSAELIKLSEIDVKMREEDRLNRDKMREQDRLNRDKMRDLERLNRETARMVEAAFLPSIPRVEKKSESFPVKGVPKVTITGRECSVTVRGWDRPEVQYNVTQYTDIRNRQPIVVKETHSDSDVNITVNNADSGPDESRRVRIEVFVPRKSNLKIDASGTIRLDGVSGELQVVGEDQSIDIRDSEGKLNVSNVDGQIRIIGFKGELVARTTDGNVRMDGDFTSINGSSNDGTFTLTVPQDIDADVAGSGNEGFSFAIEDLKGGMRISDNNWKFGKGSRKYRFTSNDGSLILQNRDLLVANNQ